MPVVETTAPYHKRNLGWPLARRGGGFRQLTLVDRYEAALYHLALTPRRSLYHDPRYGSVLYRLRTQNVTEALLQAVLEDLKRGAALYIPDIVITSIEAEMDMDEHKVKVSLFWVVRNANQSMGGDLSKEHTLPLSL